LSPKCEGCNVSGDAEMVAGKSNSFHLAAEPLFKPCNLKQANVIEINGISRGARVENKILGPAAFNEEVDDLLFLVLRSHAERKMNLTVKFLGQHVQHLKMQVTGRRNLEQG